MSTPKGTKPWNAGLSRGWKDKRGYLWLYVQEGGRRVARRAHRVAMEKHLGRRLEPWELVHHKDGNPANNDLSNLEIKEWIAHTVEHHLGSRHNENAKRAMEAFALMREELRRERQTKSDLLAALKESNAALTRLSDHCARDKRASGIPFAQDALLQHGRNESAIRRAEGGTT